MPLLLLFAQLAAQSTLISNFKSPQNQYNYLIVSPTKFLTGAENLAQFRQSFSGYKAGVVLLDSLYSQFDSAEREPYEKIWWGLKYAYESWSMPPKIVVLMGSDSLSYNFTDSTWNTLGDMPTYAYAYEFPDENIGQQFQPLFEYTDDYYAALKDSTPYSFQFGEPDSDYAVTIGRIPCDSAKQCEAYVQKVINFETRKHLNKAWFNSAMVVSDGDMEGSQPDPLGFTHLDMGEECANDLLSSWFINKIVGCAYAADSNYYKPQVEDSIVKAVNQGNIWSIFIGHGAPDLWSYDHMLTGEDVSRFHNDSTPSIFIAFSCSNGTFIQPYNNSMCKQFLFSLHGGALVYIGATAEVFAGDNAELMRAFFNTVNGNQQMPLGQVLVTAKTMTSLPNNIPYVFLGDPAIELSNGRINMSITRNNQNQISFSCKTNGTGTSSGNYDVRIYKRNTVRTGGDHYFLDSLISRQAGTFSTGTFGAFLSDTNVRVVAYVWNENGEGRMDSSFLVSVLPIVAQVNKISDVPILRIANEKLFLQARSLYGTTVRITAFTMDGKAVIRKEIAINTSELIINPKGLGLAAGTYFVRISTVKGDFAQKVIIAK